MSEDPCTIGIMHPAFTVGKKVLLEWINSFFELSYAKVEDCSSGAVYCQICDCIFGKGAVNMSKVNWNAKSEYEYVANFKLAQTAFKSNNVTKEIPIVKLAKAKFQDNLEFLQWMKHFFDCKYDGSEYNAPARRKGKVVTACVGGAPKPAAKLGAPKAAGIKAAAKPAPAAAPKKVSAKKTTKAKPAAKSDGGDGGDSGGGEEVAEMKAQLANMQEVSEGLEKERDFYFGKLRDVEILCQNNDVEFSREIILAILYKTDDDAGEAAEGGGEEEVAQEEAEEEPAADEEEETF